MITKQKAAKIGYRVIFAFLLSACSPELALVLLSSLVPAMINGDKIMASQVNSEMQKLKTKIGALAPGSQYILTGLIDRQLLVKVKTKLDLHGKPDVQEEVALVFEALIQLLLDKIRRVKAGDLLFAHFENKVVV